MRLSTTMTEEGLTLHLDGELDVVSVRRLRPLVDELLARDCRAVVVDLSALRLIDSSGIGILIHLSRRLRAMGGRLIVRGARAQPLSILRLMKLDRVLLEPSSPGAAPMLH